MTTDLILRFENDLDAQSFAAHHFGTVQGQQAPYKVINAQKRPDTYCRCPSSIVRGKGYKQGQVYGWWVCPNCNCVTKTVFDKLGYEEDGWNLIPRTLLNYLGYDDVFDDDGEYHPLSPKEWSFLLDER